MVSQNLCFIAKFKSFYGASPQVCKYVWTLLKPYSCDFEANDMLWVTIIKML